MACNPNCKVVKMKSWKGIGHNNYDQVYKRGIREKWSVWVTITSWPPTQPQEIFPCFIILTHLPSFSLYPTLHWSCWLGQSSCWIQSKTIPLHWGAASLDGHSRQSHKAWHQKFGSSIAVLSKEHENDESLGKLDVGVPPRSPSICKVAWLEPVLNVVIFLLGLQGNQVHTVFPVWWIALNFPPLFFSPAEVAAIQPVIFDLLIGGHVSTIKVIVSLILESLWSCDKRLLWKVQAIKKNLTCRALPRNWGGEQFAFAGLLACLPLSCTYVCCVTKTGPMAR